ncbi:MAG: COR domain-containing protein [Cytophagales bacterium]|nr:COR domain-containing protein [Cytophagales bacterium]
MKHEDTFLTNLINKERLEKSGKIDLSGLSISQIPEELVELPFLKSIDLSQNRITDLTLLSKFSNLVELNINGNLVENLNAISELVDLQSLDVSVNKISDIQSLKNLTKLTKLNLSQNEVENIGPLAFLHNLKSLNLRNNRIRNLEPLKNLSMLKTLNCEENKIQFPPIEIANFGLNAINAFFKTLDESGVETDNLNSAIKLILLGSEASGKTSILKRLMDQPFDPNGFATHGITRNNWVIDKTDADQGVNLKVWDFGGQEIMHSTHELFLSQRSIYILVLDGRKEEDSEHWLNLIQFYGGDSPIIVVLNKVDLYSSFEVNRRYLQSKYKNISTFIRTSCLTGEGISQLREKIIELYEQSPSKDLSLPRKWSFVKMEIESLAEYDNYTNIYSYQEICKKHALFSSSEQYALLSFLHDLGVVIYSKSISLHPIIVLNPIWLTQKIYDIILSREVYSHNGVIRVSQIPEILKGEETLVNQFLIRILNDFEIALMINKELIMIPSQLTMQEPALEIEQENSISLLVKYEFLPNSVIHRMIIAFYEEIKDKLCWRLGLCISSKTFASTALIRSDIADRSISIKVYGENRREYLTVIRNELHRINKTYRNIQFTERVPIPNTSVTSSLEHLLRLEQMGVEEFLPDGAFEMIEIKPLLEGFGNLPNNEEIQSILSRITGSTKSA